MTRRLLLLVFVIGAGCASPPSTPVTERASTSVLTNLTLTVHSGDRPIEGAELQILWQTRESNGRANFVGIIPDGGTTATTDSTGIVHLSLEHPVGIHFRVRKSWFGTVDSLWLRRLSANEGDVVSIDVPLEPETLVRGRVVDILGHPFTDGHVSTDFGEPSWLDRNGAYLLHALGTKCDYRVSVDSWDGSIHGSWTVRVSEWRDGEVHTVYGGGSISLDYTFADPVRAPPRVASCAVLLQRQDADDRFYPELRFQKTLDGSHDWVELTELYPGTYRVSMRAKGFGAGTITTNPLDGHRKTVALTRGRTVTGRVVDARGEPLPGARVGLGADDPQPALTDETGAFTIDDMPLEDTALTVSLDGFETDTLPLLSGEHALPEAHLLRR